MKKLTKILLSAALMATLFGAGLFSRQVLAGPSDPPRPTVTAAPLVYNGEMQSPQLVGYDPETMRLDGQLSHKFVGTYELRVWPKSGKWRDGTTFAVPVKWQITRQIISTVNGTGYRPDLLQFGSFIKWDSIMNIKTPSSGAHVVGPYIWQKRAADGSWQNFTMDNNPPHTVKAGTYRVKLTLEGLGSLDDRCFATTLTVKIDGQNWTPGEVYGPVNGIKACYVDIYSPTIEIADPRPAKPTNLSADPLEFNNASQTVVIKNFDAATMKFSPGSRNSASDVGTYKAIIWPKDGKWKNDETGEVIVKWRIYPKGIQDFIATTYSIETPNFGDSLETPVISPTLDSPYIYRDLKWLKWDGAEWSETGTSGPIGAGTYRVFVDIKSHNSNYLLVGLNGTITINGEIWTVDYHNYNDCLHALSPEFTVIDASTIDPAKPTIATPTELTYTGLSQSPILAGYNEATMNATSISATNAGTYTAKITSKTGQWADGTTDAVMVTWKINKQRLTDFEAYSYNANDSPVIGANLYEIDLTARDSAPYTYDNRSWQKKNGANWVSATGTVTVSDTYAIKARIVVTDFANYTVAGLNVGDTVNVGGHMWTVLSVDPSSIEIRSAELVASASADPVKPVISELADFYYNGLEQSPFLSSFDPEKMNVTGNIATNVGTYTVTITSKTGQWYGGDTDAVTVEWNIYRAHPTVTVPIGLEGTIDEPISSVALPAGFSWNDPTATIALGSNVFSATFIPADTANYNNVSGISIAVLGRDHTYDFLEGANQIYTVGVDTAAVFRIDSKFSLFANKVYVNDVEVSADKYTAINGSTKITLKGAYLDTLADGVYNLRVAFNNGRVARTQFTVRRLPAVPTPGNNGNTSTTQTSTAQTNMPKTGVGQSVSLLVVVIGFFALLLGARALKASQEK